MEAIVPHTTEHGLSQEMRTCAEECLRCYAACEETESHCIMVGGRHADPQHLNALADCAKICEASASFLVRMSDLHPHVCRVCAEACDRCARSCEEIDRNDETMRRCIEACRRCEESCRRMAA